MHRTHPWDQKSGFTFSGIVTLLNLFYAYFFILDYRGRSSRDIDCLFYSNVPGRKFHKEVVVLRTMTSSSVYGLFRAAHSKIDQDQKCFGNFSMATYPQFVRGLHNLVPHLPRGFPEGIPNVRVVWLSGEVDRVDREVWAIP